MSLNPTPEPVEGETMPHRLALWRAVFVLAATAAVSCFASEAKGPSSPPAAAAQPQATASASVADLSWFAGAWRAEQGKMAFEERWTDGEGGAMLATSKTLSGGKMVFFEFLRIVAGKEGGVAYVAQPAGRPPTEFRLTSLDGQSAVFENPEHDHPKVIRYWRNADGSMTAKVEGVEGGKPVEQTFEFKPVRK
jgi:hypothetical protein